MAKDEPFYAQENPSAGGVRLVHPSLGTAGYCRHVVWEVIIFVVFVETMRLNRAVARNGHRIGNSKNKRSDGTYSSQRKPNKAIEPDTTHWTKLV